MTTGCRVTTHPPAKPMTNKKLIKMCVALAQLHWRLKIHRKMINMSLKRWGIFGPRWAMCGPLEQKDSSEIPQRSSVARNRIIDQKRNMTQSLHTVQAESISTCKFKDSVLISDQS